MACLLVVSGAGGLGNPASGGGGFADRFLATDLIPDLSITGLGDEEPADDGGDQCHGDRVDEPRVDVALWIAGWIEGPQGHTQEGREARPAGYAGGPGNRVVHRQPTGKLP